MSGGIAERVFRKYGVELHRFLLRRLRRSQDAEDLAQEVYMRLLQVRHTEGVENLQAYAYAIASRLVTEHRIREARERSAPSWLDEIEPATDDSLESLNAQGLLAAARRMLSPKHWDMVSLKGEGFTVEEVARRLRCSPHTVKKYLNQANRIIRTLETRRSRGQAR